MFYIYAKMVLKSKENSVGAWAFFIGVILSIVVGVSTTFFIPLSKIGTYSSPLYAILILLGIFVGSKIKV